MLQKTITFLGTGTSQGIPIIGCECEVCQSQDAHDRRLRTSALLTYKGKNILFDTSADFREQMLREKVENVDFVLFTHEHRDHTAGLDELRPYTWRTETPIPIYAEKHVMKYLKVCFPHIMGTQKYPGGAKLEQNIIDETPFFLPEVGEVIPIRMTHFAGMNILGYRISDFAYLTDCKTIDAENLAKLKGLEVLVINALGRKSHPSHLSLSEALEIVEHVQPKRTFLTHIGHSLGLYKEVVKELPEGVALAYDGLKVIF